MFSSILSAMALAWFMFGELRPLMFIRIPSDSTADPMEVA